MRGLPTKSAVTPLRMAIARTPVPLASCRTTVPAPSGRNEFLTTTGIPRATAGRIVAGWRTLAPKNASSAASAELTSGTRRAWGTSRGSAVRMPSTSVQISMAPTSRPASFSAAPKSAAEQSDPPRPRVVVAPPMAAPTKPPVTTTRPAASSGRTRAATRRAVSASSASAAPCVASVARISRGSIQTAWVPRARSAAATNREDTSSPRLRSASDVRGETSSSREIPRESSRARSSSISKSSAQAFASPFGSARASSAARWRAARTSSPASAAALSLPLEEIFNSTRRSVTPPIAETTTRHGSPPRVPTRRATSRIRSAVPTEVPPNLRTSVKRSPSRGSRSETALREEELGVEESRAGGSAHRVVDEQRELHVEDGIGPQTADRDRHAGAGLDVADGLRAVALVAHGDGPRGGRRELQALRLASEVFERGPHVRERGLRLELEKDRLGVAVTHRHPVDRDADRKVRVDDAPALEAAEDLLRLALDLLLFAVDERDHIGV